MCKEAENHRQCLGSVISESDFTISTETMVRGTVPPGIIRIE
jgi:hypothetical protein